MVRPSPFEKVDSRDRFGFEPHALLHLLGSETLPPASCLLLRQVREGALRCGQAFDLCKNLTASRRDEAGTYSRRVMEFFALLEANNQSI